MDKRKLCLESYIYVVTNRCVYWYFIVNLRMKITSNVKTIWSYENKLNSDKINIYENLCDVYTFVRLGRNTKKLIFIVCFEMLRSKEYFRFSHTHERTYQRQYSWVFECLDDVEVVDSRDLLLNNRIVSIRILHLCRVTMLKTNSAKIKLYNVISVRSKNRFCFMRFPSMQLIQI